MCNVFAIFFVIYRVCTLGWKSTEAEAFCFSLGCMGFVGFRDDYVQAPVMGETMFITYAKCRGEYHLLYLKYTKTASDILQFCEPLRL